MTVTFGMGTNTPEASLEINGDLSTNSDITVSTVFWIGSDCGFRNNGSGDLEYTENSGGTWTDLT